VRPRVWCFTPNPVLEKKFDEKTGRCFCSKGGKGRNVARQLQQWGIPTISVSVSSSSILGTDPGSDPKAGAGERQGWAWVREGIERIDFFTEDLKVGSMEWRKIREYWMRNLKSGDWWVVAGSSATGWPRGWWKKLIGDLQKKGVTVLVDSRGALIREAVEAGADWIKCNLAEAEETTGNKGFERCIRNLTGNGTTGVVVTLGKDGLAADVNGSMFSIPAPKVKVKDPTGSGDVVTAALIYGEIRGWTSDKTLRIAAGVGAWKVSQVGDVAKVCLRD
jgi:fructose-1-phosphate kinase PfkB-like protein